MNAPRVALRFVVLLVACGSDHRSSSEPVQVGGGVDAGTPRSALCTSCGACEQALTPQSAHHVDGDLQYPDPPPTGGDHNACWADWGVHASEVGDEHWVHNLEHGGIVYLHNCPDGCDAEVQAMGEFALAHKQALVTPYGALPKKFAVVAWGYRLVSDCFDRASFEAFYTKHVDHAPESLADYPPKGCHTED